MNEKTLSRRSILKFAGVGVAASAAAGAAGLAQAKSAGANWDETFEVVVVGSGGAGMAAAVKAAQTGAKKVVVLENSPLRAAIR